MPGTDTGFLLNCTQPLRKHAFEVRLGPDVREVLRIDEDGTIVLPGQVTLRPDGTVEFADGYNPDTAVRMFWEAVAAARNVTPFDTV